MTVKSKVTMDLQKASPVSVIQAVQHDRYCRYVEMALYADEIPWQIPEGATVVITYSKPDGKAGVYEALPDGTTAWSAEENRLTIALAPQLFTAPGIVSLMVSVIQEEKQISTFVVLLNVCRAIAAENGESETYSYVTTFLPMPVGTEAGQYLRVSAVDEAGRVTALEGTNDAASGKDGVSPVVETERIPAQESETGAVAVPGHTILRITDALGTREAIVYDGKNGENGSAVLLFADSSNPDSAGYYSNAALVLPENRLPAVGDLLIGEAGRLYRICVTGTNRFLPQYLFTLTGADGQTPHIGSNGNWYLGTEDTGVKASGEDGAPGPAGTDGAPGKDGAAGKDGLPGADGYTPIRGIDYYTDADKAEMEAYIVTELAKRGQLAPEYAKAIDECTDITKLYVLPDGFLYAYMLTEVEGGPAYTNVLPNAIQADGTPYVGNNGEKGYKTDWRLNSSRVEKEAAGRCCTGFIPVKSTDVIRFKNIRMPADKNCNGYAHFYGSDFTTNTGKAFEQQTGTTNYIFGDEILLVPKNLTALGADNVNATDATAYMRISTGIIDDTSIITINEEIVQGGMTTGYGWANTGLAFVPADYEARIVALEKKLQMTSDHSVDAVRNWDAPIYDDAPVFLCTEDKPAMGEATVAAVYARYDALMAAHPSYITRRDLGLASDGVTHIYRYDFCEPGARKNPENTNHPNPEKPKAIICSGIHLEYAGIYGLYHALEEITNNPELYYDLRCNTHLIVVPALNPYCLNSGNYAASNGRKNANGVEIHRNFQVDHVVIDAASNNYGGALPLSEVESQYLDAVMAENSDAQVFLTCHNFDYDTYFGSGFIWPSVATRYMYNMGSRLIGKMSRAWRDKYGDTFQNGVDAVKTSLVADGDYSVGMVGMSGTPGTETKHAMKYGIHGANIEIAKMFKVFNSTEGSSEVMTHGAEVYINFLRMVFRCAARK